MNSFVTLTVLQIILHHFPRLITESKVGYKREGITYASKELDGNRPFSYISGYPICPPASNLDCLVFRSWSEKEVKRCGNERIWTGVGFGDVPMKDFGYMPGDRVAFRGCTGPIPDSWLLKECTLEGNFGMAKCTTNDMYQERKVQVVKVENKWHAVRTVHILVSEEPYLRSCWQGERMVDACNSTLDLNCECLEYSLGTIWVQRGPFKIPVDAVGVRTVLMGSAKPRPGTGFCDLTKRDNEWYIETNRNLEGLKMKVRKGPHEVVCDPDDLGRVCYDKGWNLFSDVIKVNLYLDGFLYAICSADDNANEFCREISYLYRWKHYQCWSYFEHVSLTLLILISLLFSLIICAAFCVFWSKFFQCLWWFCLPIRWCGQSLRSRKARKEDLVKLLEEGDLGYSRKTDSAPAAKTSLSLKKAALGIMLATAKDVNAQCTSLDFLSFVTNCNQEQCTLTGKAFAYLPSRNGVACFDTRGPGDRTMDLSYEIHIDQVFRQCVPFDEYWTSDYYPKACSEFYCPSTCWAMSQSALWTYLQGCSVTPNSLIIKQTHQGCAGVGCFRCDDACVLYTKFFVQSKWSQPYRVIKCQSWEPKMQGTIVRQSGANSTRASFTITTLQPIEVLGLKLQWNYETSSFTFPLVESFVVSDERICMVHASRKGFPVKGQIGYVQCGSMNDTFVPGNCLKMEDDIECTVGNKAEVACRYIAPRIDQACKNAWLPVERSGVIVIVADKLPAVSAHDFGLSQIVFEPTEGEIARFIEPKSSCKILDGEVTGCYSCDEGAELSLVSQPVNGAPTIRVTCEKSIANFKFVCGENPIRVHAHQSLVDTKCTAFWGSKSAAFKIKGLLVEVIDLPKFSTNGTLNHVIDRNWQMPSFYAFKKHLIIASIISFLLTFIGIFFWCNCRR